MKKSFKKIAAAVLVAVCALSLTACDSFYQLFVDEEVGEEGVYFTVYDETSTDEEIAAIPDVHVMAGDLRNEIKNYGLSFEVTLAFDTETENEASLSFYYYHNRNDENASDYCRIGAHYLGTYTMEGDKITFYLEPEGYNMAFYEVGSDYADLEQFRQFSYADDKSNGVWAYEYATYEYESEAVIEEAILYGVPEVIEITVSGKNIVSWEAGQS